MKKILILICVLSSFSIAGNINKNEKIEKNHLNDKSKIEQNKEKTESEIIFDRVLQVDKQFQGELTKRINKLCGTNTIKKYKDEILKSNKTIEQLNKDKEELTKKLNEAISVNDKMFLKYKDLLEKYKKLKIRTKDNLTDSKNIKLSETDFSLTKINEFQVKNKKVYRGELFINGKNFKISKGRVIRYKGNKIKIISLNSEYVNVSISDKKGNKKTFKIFLEG